MTFHSEEEMLVPFNLIVKEIIHNNNNRLTIGTPIALIIGKNTRPWNSYMKSKIKKRNRAVTISGIMLPTEWDDGGNVIGLAIHTNDEERYQIDNLNEKSELLSLLRARLKATGILKRDATGNNFTVKGYKIDNSEK